MTSTILIVDDQIEIVDALVDCLDWMGYETCTAANGEEGLRVMNERNPDLVVTDYMMPIMDGGEFAKAIRQNSGVPIILLTALGQMDQTKEARDIVDAFLAKPVRIDQFEAKVVELLSQRP